MHVDALLPPTGRNTTANTCVWGNDSGSSEQISEMLVRNAVVKHYVELWTV